MKKLFAMLLAAAMLLSLCACGSPSKPKELEDISDEDWEAAAEALEDMYEEEPAVVTEAAVKMYEIGDTILSDDGMVELVIDSIGYTDIMNEIDCVPVEADHLHATKAEEGKTYFIFSGTLTYVGDSKEKLYYSCSTELDYNNGYTFKDGSGDGSLQMTGGDYNQTSNGCSFEVLTNNTTVEINAFLRVPEVVETDTESPLLLYVKLFRKNPDLGTVIEATFQLR